MKNKSTTFTFFIFIFTFHISNICRAQSEINSAPPHRTSYDNIPQGPAMIQLEKLNYFFNKKYRSLAAHKGQNIFPLLLVESDTIKLYTADGKKREIRSTIQPPFNELKAVSHIGAAIFAIGYEHWNNIEDKDDSWISSLKEYQQLIEQTIPLIQQTDWTSSAWNEQYAQHIKTWMHDSITYINEQILHIIKKRTFTRQDYGLLALNYMHTMDSTMFLTNISETKELLDKLGAWRQTLGEKRWDKLHVLVYGEFGRPGAGLTIDTHPLAYKISQLMKKELLADHFFILPQMKSERAARSWLGAIKLAKELGKSAFSNEWSRQNPSTAGLFRGLNNPRTNLSMEFHKMITQEYLNTGKVELPDPKFILQQQHENSDSH